MIFATFNAKELYAENDSAKLLSQIIEKKDWHQLDDLFVDKSFSELPKLFADASDVRFVYFNQDKFIYKAKLPNHCEIGTITFQKNGPQFSDLLIQNRIGPLFDIAHYDRYAVSDLKIQMGDIAIHLEKGDLFTAQPLANVHFFVGKMKTVVSPKDIEEQETLRQITKSLFYIKESDWAILILPLSPLAETAVLKSGLPQRIDQTDKTMTLIKAYLDRYFGIFIQQFSEHWYMPFNENDNLIILPDKKDVLLLDFNENRFPDTQMRSDARNQILLSYNAIPGIKLSRSEEDNLTSLKLNLFYNPESKHLSGTSVLEFLNEKNFRTLRLHPDLQIKANLDSNSQGMSVVRKDDEYYILGPRQQKLSFFYQGKLIPPLEMEDHFKTQIYRPDNIIEDPFIYLPRYINYYPNPGIDFTKTDISFSLPSGWGCLSTGTLISQTQQGDRTIHRFTSENSKGASLIIGSFSAFQTQSTSQTLNTSFFAANDFIQQNPPKALQTIEKHFNLKRFQDAYQLFAKKLCPLPFSQLNILFRRGPKEGGISDQGLITIAYNPDIELSARINRYSPIFLPDSPTSYLLHELAHQWFGGLISWNSYRDVWLTEGFAHFMTLYFYQKTLDERSFSQILRQQKQWVEKNNNFGPIIYGNRIDNIFSNFIAFQSIVYNKAALVLNMLKNYMGEDNFFSQLKKTLSKYQYQSLSSREFIRVFCQDDQNLVKFFEYWVFHRQLPKCAIRYRSLGSTLTVEMNSLDNSQNPLTPIFPLAITIETDQGEETQVLRVNQKVQVFEIQAKSFIKKVSFNVLEILAKIDISRFD